MPGTDPVGPVTVAERLRGDAGRLRPGPRLTPAASDVHRARLMAGMAEAAAEKGYSAVTIADVVARAEVSRRTFYEHFADKEACFLATYEACADVVMATIGDAVADVEGWERRLEAGVCAYLKVLAGEPGLTRVFLLDILGAGPAAIERRRAVHRRFAELIDALVELQRPELPPGAGLDPATATAIIGAMNELVLLAVEEGRADDLMAYAGTGVRLIRAAVLA